MVAFSVLNDSSTRVAAERKLEEAQTLRVATQGEVKQFKQWAKAWQKELATGCEGKVTSGQQFQRALGGF